MYNAYVSMNIYAQIVGFIALLSAIAVFQSNDRKKMLYIQLLTALLFAVHYGLLGAWTGVAMNLIGGARNYIFIRTRRQIWLYVVIITFIAASIVTWQSAYSVLPLVGMVSGTIAFWMSSSSKIRYLALLSPPVWFIYNFLVGSYAGLLAEMFIFASIIVGIQRFDRSLVKKHIMRMQS